MRTKQEKPIHVPSDRLVNDVSAPSSVGIEPVSRLYADQTEWQQNVSRRQVHANKTRETNARTEVQSSQRRQCSEFGWN